MTVPTVLFDLDGTLAESAPGIIAALRHAFAVNGLPALEVAQEMALIGPPFADALPPLVGAARYDAVVAAYRERYIGGAMYETRAYDGIEDLLISLTAQGIPLAVATSKPEAYAPAIVEHLGLRRYFRTVCGDDLDETRGSKALVIAEAVRRLGNPPAEATVMVGDRSHDVLGARANGLNCFGVGWGYGLPGELETAGAVAVAATPSDLGPMLDTWLADRTAASEHRC